jgi:hypothetical protein
MKITTTYGYAQHFAPKAVEEVIAKLRKGTSVHKNADPSELEWHFEWCVGVTGGTFAQVIGNLGWRVVNQSVEQQVEDEVSRSTAWVSASKGRWWGQSKTLEKVPEAIVYTIRERLEQADAERKAFKAKSKQEQQTEINGLLSQLSKDSGFMAFKV